MRTSLIKKVEPAAPARLKMALDSGAFSLYTSFSSPRDKEGEKIALRFDRKRANYDYFEGKEFKEYLERYIAYLHARKNEYEFYVTVDVIFNPKKTEEVQTYLESCGLNPLPVYHVGERVEVLKKLMDKYEYIGIGGLGQEVTKQKFITFADEAFKVICDKPSKEQIKKEQKFGAPKRRIHGFALSSSEMLARYPYHSVDATSSLLCSRMGGIMVPRLKGKELDYISAYMHLALTDRRSEFPYHYAGTRGDTRDHIDRYLNEVVQDSVTALKDSYLRRDAANLIYISNMVDQVEKTWSERLGKKHELKYYVSGKPNGSMQEFALERLPSISQRTGGKLHFSYLGTFYTLGTTENLLHFTRGLMPYKD